MRSREPSSRIKELVISGVFFYLLTVNGLNAESCKVGCPQSDSGILQFAPGKVYEYNIDSLMTIGINGNDVDETSLKMTGQANLYAEGNCGYTLQLDQVVVSAVKESLEKQIIQNINKPIKFTLVSGELQPDICADPTDTVASLNIKRGIASLLQASDKPYETDVFGVCPTLTSVSKVGSAEIITKVRNLNACTYREKIANGLVNGVVNSKAGVKSSAVLNADYSKELKLVQGIVENVHLIEEYKFAALANGAGVAKAKVRTILQLGKVGRGNAPAGPKELGSVIFDQPFAPPVKNIAALKKAFTNTLNLVNEHVQGDAAQYFTELIRLMRSSDSETLTELSVIPHVNKILARKVYLDALFRVGTSSAVKAIVRQVSKMSDKEKKLAFLSLNLVQAVEKDALNQATSLLNPNSPKEAYLAIGSLVNKYCKLGTCDQSEVNVVSKKFADSLKRCKANTKKDEDRFVNILKGIRNTHKIADASVQVLAECASADRSARLRVAAIQAFTAAACNSALQGKALSILKDHNEDSEIRIEAYLAAIACPNALLANEIAEVVNNEPVYQVGGFIASSLKAIRDSTDSSRESSRNLLGNIRVTKKFPIDPRRYSFNSELSYAIESLGIGASADYNLIYSQKGYLPRSARLNLTSEIFGSNFNILEINARQENLEQILGYYFGPKGLIKTEGRNLITNLAGKAARSKRSILDDTGKFAKKYKTYGSKSTANLNLDLAIRVFGSELFFISLADDVPQTIDDIQQKFAEMSEKLKGGLKNFEEEYSCHALFLDTEFIYPTGVGLPLELVVQGTSASKLGVVTEIDVDSIVENPRKTKYRVKLVPSVDVNVNGQLRFNALVLVAGLRTSSSLHSSTGSDVRFELVNDGTSFNVDVAFPRENLELVDFKHKVEFTISEQDKETKVVPLKLKKKKNALQENCFDQLHYIGMTVCFTSVLPDTTGAEAIGFPLSGPIHLALRLQTERNIKIMGGYEKTPNSRLWKLKYSTPNSQVPHDTELSFQVGTQPKIFARAALIHPEIRLSGEAGINNDDSEVSLYGQYDVNGDATFQKLGFIKNGDEYRPLIEIKTSKGVSNEINGYRADGRIVKHVNGNIVRYKYENFQLINKDNDPIIVNGWVDIKPFNSELNVLIGPDSYEIKSHFSAENGFSAGLFVRNENSPHSNGASIALQLSQDSVKDAFVVSIADYFFEVNNNFDFIRDAQNTVEQSKFKNDIILKQGNTLLFEGKLNGDVGPKQVQLNLEASKDKKKASVVLNLAKDQNSPGDVNFNVYAKLNQYFVDVKAKVDVKGVRFITDNSVTTSWGTQLTANGEFGQRFTPQDIYIDLQGTFLITPKDKQSSWLLKMVGTPDKTTADFKLNRDNAELIVLNGETTHPQDKIATGKLNLQVKDLLGAKADFKINKGGKGDLTALLNFKKAQRKINVDSKFTIAAPKYETEVTVTYDTDKKLFLKTENVIDKSKMSTKNILDINGDKFVLDASGFVKGEWRLNGEVDGKLSLTVPNGRQLNGQLNRKVTTAKNGLSQGAMTINISDKLPTNEKRTLELSGVLEKYNARTKEIVVVSNLVYTSLAGKTLELTQKIKHLLKGTFKSIDYSLKGQGDILNSPAEVSIVVDEYSPNHAIFRFSGIVGEHINTNVNGNYYLGDRAKPAMYELEASIAAPQSNFKTYRIFTSGKYLRPETEDGIISIELHLDEQAGESSIKLDTFAKGNRHHGSYNLDLTSSRLPSSLKLDGSFSRETQGEGTGDQKYSVNYAYGDKFIKTGLDISYSDFKSGVVHFILDSTLDSIKKLDVMIHTIKTDDSIEMNNELQLNGQKYVLDTQVFTNEHKKGVAVKAVLPEKTTTASCIMEILGERKGKLTLSITNLGDLDLDHSAEVNLKAFDDFYISSHTNSQKLKVDNLDLDIRAQTGVPVKAVELSLKNAKGIILAGAISYAVKKEKSKTIIEGQGQIRYYQTSNNANFKIVHQLFDVTSDQEVGYSFTFNGTFGPKNAVSTLKMTNKNFQAKVSICEEKKQCTNVEVRSIVTVDQNDFTSIQHDLMILVDLRELGYPHEFELQSKSSRKGLKFNHEIESNVISNTNIKYQLAASISPLTNKITIKLPSREISIETEEVFPQQVFGHYHSSVVFYFDRLNKPNDITKLIASVDIGGVDKVAINGKGEIRFEHPKIRPLSISGLLDVDRNSRVIKSELMFDIFKTPEQKIIAKSIVKGTSSDGKPEYYITSENIVKSAGLGFQYEASAYSGLSLERQELTGGFNLQSGVADVKASGKLFASKDRVEVDLNGFNEQLFALVAECNRNKYSGKINANIQVFALKPFTLNAEVDQSTAKLALKRAELFDAVVEIKLGKEAKFNLKNGSTKLVSGRVALDAPHFLTTSFERNEQDIKSFLAAIEKTLAEESKAAKEQLEKRFQKITQDIDHQKELAKNSVPDFSALQLSIRENVNGILTDLENDPAIKQILENYRKHYETAFKFYEEISKTIGEAYEQINRSVYDLWSQIQAILKKTVLPAWEEFAKKMSVLLSELQMEVIKLLTNVLEQVVKSLKSLEADLKALGKPVYETLKPISDSLQELIKTLMKDFEELLAEVKEYLSKLPSFDAVQEEIKQKLAKLKVIDEILVFLRNVMDQLNSFSATSESTELTKKLYNYLEAKLRDTAVDDAATLGDLFNAFINALNSIWKRWADIQPPTANYIASLPFSLELVSSLPGWISFRSSVLNFIINEKLEGILDWSELLKPPFNFLPPFNLVGHIADGKNIFTFDGQEFAFQGSCKYVLAQDADQNDFSVIATVKDGKLKALTLIDPKNFVEISDTAILKLNGKPTEFPVHVDNIHAWRRFYTLRLVTEYGVEVTCTNDLKVCHITVDGFYTSKTRGLLGNGNAEPFDDYTTVDGKIANNYAEFVNDYGLGNCPAIAVSDIPIEHDPICSELFALDSTLALGYLFMDKKIYRKACDEAVLTNTENKEEAACNIGLTYASGASKENIPAFLPNRCLKCAGPAGQREIGDEFSVKLPTNKADVVFVVDIDSSKNIIDNLVSPSIIELRNQLKSRGLTDSQIIVIAYSGDQMYPALLTSNGGKLNYNGKLSNVVLNGPRRPEPLNVGVPVLNEIINTLNNLEYLAAPQADEKAFRFALQYPFRAGAAKSIIAVRSKSLDYNISKLLRAYVIGSLTQFNGASLHMIAPVKDIAVDGVPSEKLVGFNSRIIATTDGKDAKKRQKLKFINDMGIEFVLKNQGWVFAAQNFDAISADDQKRAYLNQVSSSIADTLFKIDIVSDCKCVPSFGLHAEHKCSIKSSNFVPNKRPKGA